MYCRNCGQKLADGDKFCSSCGAKTILASESEIKDTGAENLQPQINDAAEQKEEPLFEPFDFKAYGFDFGSESESEEDAAEPKKPVAPVEDFDWNIHSFPGNGVEKTEEVDFNWSLTPEEAAAEEAKKATEMAAEPAPEVLAPKEPEWKPEAPAGDAPKAEAAPASSLEEELFGGLENKTDEARKQSEEIDKFFTFHKKNEEFQRLLDQEYEKIKSGNILSEEMDTAAAASEEKFAARQPEDPMEELFAAEGVVKGYEPKPVESDVLERIEAAEAEKKAREEAANLIEEEKAKARAAAEQKAKEEAEALAKAREAEEAARLRLDEEAKRIADARAAEEAAEREQARAAARAEAEAALKETEEKAEQERLEAEAKLQAEAEARKAAAEKAAKAKAEEEAKAAAAAKAAEEKAEKELDPLNHISEMVRARETFFGQESLESLAQADEPEEEELPEKTKAVDKAAILAGMATASEMVQRDRAAAAEAARAAAEAEAQANAAPAEDEPEAVEIPDFLGHLAEEVQQETTADAPEPELELETVPEEKTEEADIFAQLEQINVPQQEEPAAERAEDLDEIPPELFSLDDLLDANMAASEEPAEPQAEEAPKTDKVTDATLIMTEESVAELLDTQVQTDAEDKPLTETMVFTAADMAAAAEAAEAAEEASEEPAAEANDMITAGIADLAAGEEEEEYDDEEETGGKGRVVLKICLVILIILLLMEIAGVAIKVAAPTSGAAKFIDSQLNKVIHLFTGDDAEYSVLAAVEDIRTTAMEDKTSLIAAEMEKNKDGNIETIEYNADLKFDPGKKYENTDLNMTQNLADICWYKDAENKQVYFDQAIVGSVIAYDSQKVNLVNNNDKTVLNLVKEGTDFYKDVESLGNKGNELTFKTLQIGEIRQAGSSYYVWVSEKTQDMQKGSQTVNRIYEMQPEGETMQIVASYSI